MSLAVTCGATKNYSVHIHPFCCECVAASPLTNGPPRHQPHPSPSPQPWAWALALWGAYFFCILNLLNPNSNAPSTNSPKFELNCQSNRICCTVSSLSVGATREMSDNRTSTDESRISLPGPISLDISRAWIHSITALSRKPLALTMVGHRELCPGVCTGLTSPSRCQ